MGLDAFVYCDCYEKGRFRTPPPHGVLLHVEPDGALECDNDTRTSFDAARAFDRWRVFSACEHVGGVLRKYRLGDISHIGLLRSELQREADRIPILLTKVVYSGTHTGDYLAVETLPALQRELELLGEFGCSSREVEKSMEYFRAAMSELATTALSVSKPIAF